MYEQKSQKIKIKLCFMKRARKVSNVHDEVHFKEE